ncbi:MAG: Maf family protein, partial [Aquincola tertiaricarbonis]
LDLVHRSMALMARTSLAAEGRGETALAEHQRIVDAIAAGDGAAADRALRQHISMAWETRLKLDAARKRLARRGLAEAPILASDTTVAIGRRILGKPADAAEAAEMLAALSGRTHRVLTAVAVSSGRATLLELSVSRVRFAELSAQDIRRYIDTGEPFGKAGAYGIQGPAAVFVAHIEGSYSGIMGLPLHETATLLRRARVLF